MSVVAALARRLVSRAVRRLPPGDVRRRYQREFEAELHGMTPAQQLRHAVGLHGTVRALRRAVTAPAAGQQAGLVSRAGAPVPLRCRVLRQHRWCRRRTEDGSGGYLVCARCGKERVPTGWTAMGPPIWQ